MSPLKNPMCYRRVSSTAKFTQNDLIRPKHNAILNTAQILYWSGILLY